MKYFVIVDKNMKMKSPPQRSEEAAWKSYYYIERSKITISEFMAEKKKIKFGCMQIDTLNPVASIVNK